MRSEIVLPAIDPVSHEKLLRLSLTTTEKEEAVVRWEQRPRPDGEHGIAAQDSPHHSGSNCCYSAPSSINKTSLHELANGRKLPCAPEMLFRSSCRSWPGVSDKQFLVW